MEALRSHLNELYKIEEACTITRPQPKLLRLAKEANRANAQSHDLFDNNVQMQIINNNGINASNNVDCHTLLNTEMNVSINDDICRSNENTTTTSKNNNKSKNKNEDDDNLDIIF